MPIYEYRCSTCGFQKEYLQKISDPLLSSCPECGKASFQKMLTAAGFHLKGSGWYASDFKGNGSKPPAGKAAPAKTGESAKPNESAKATESVKPEVPAAGAAASAPSPVAESGS